jgi:DNA-binding FadR family transcriptional regulator
MLSLPNAFHRVFVQINLLANSDAKEQSTKIIPRQQDLANMVNTSRETVSRALQTLIKQGILSKNGHQISVEQSELLNQLAQNGPQLLEKNV